MRRSVLLLLLLALAGCGTAAASPAPHRLRVVATTTQVADLVRDVAGERASVVQLLRPGIDPHDYEPSPADVQDVADADVVVENGAGLEDGWLDLTLAASGFSGRRVVASRGVLVHDGDPHVWQDPRNAEIMVADIAAALAAADPADADAFRARAAAYTVRLRQLDARIAAQIATIPPDQRKLVTNHDAFGYYVARYGLTYVGSVVPSFDTAAALSGSALSALAARVRATGTRAVFSETSLPGSAAAALAREAGVRVVQGDDALYGDSLGPAGSPGATYIGMEEHNTAVIVGALR